MGVLSRFLEIKLVENSELNILFTYSSEYLYALIFAAAGIVNKMFVNFQ